MRSERMDRCCPISPSVGARLSFSLSLTFNHASLPPLFLPHGALIARLNYISREEDVAAHGRTNLPCLLHSLSLFRGEDLIKRLDEPPVCIYPLNKREQFYELASTIFAGIR